MSTEQNKMIARRFFAEQDQRKGPLAEEICAASYTASIAGFPPMDRAGHSQFGVIFYRAFPDMFHMIEETIGEGQRGQTDKVLVAASNELFGPAIDA